LTNFFQNRIHPWWPGRWWRIRGERVCRVNRWIILLISHIWCICHLCVLWTVIHVVRQIWANFTSIYLVFILCTLSVFLYYRYNYSDPTKKNPVYIYFSLFDWDFSFFAVPLLLGTVLQSHKSIFKNIWLLEHY
jgi:hypothetical protein